MKKHRFIAAAIITSAVLNAVAAYPKTATPPSPETAVNRGVVQLETAGAAGTSVRIAEDLANVIDDGATRRVLPVVGKGAVQNLTDLKLLRGIDMAILESDVLDYVKSRTSFPGSSIGPAISPSSIMKNFISSPAQRSRQSRI
jgi:TRAP-type uncharacterized transport system substrate-binding protein